MSSKLKKHEVEVLRKAIGFLKRRPTVQSLYFNDKGEYLASKKEGFENEIGRDEILAAETTLPPPEEQPAPVVNTGEQAEKEKMIAEMDEKLTAERNKSADLELALKGATKDAGELGAALSETKAIAEKLDSDLTEKLKHIAELEEIIKAQDEEIKKLNATKSKK